MNKLLFIVFAAFSAACSDTTPLPADPQATPETQALYRNLFRIADEGVMFGHQDDALYGLEIRGGTLRRQGVLR